MTRPYDAAGARLATKGSRRRNPPTYTYSTRRASPRRTNNGCGLERLKRRGAGRICAISLNTCAYLKAHPAGPARQRGPPRSAQGWTSTRPAFMFQKPPSCTKLAFAPFVHELSLRDGEVSPVWCADAGLHRDRRPLGPVDATVDSARKLRRGSPQAVRRAAEPLGF
jgi:hypothetical protein